MTEKELLNMIEEEYRKTLLEISAFTGLDADQIDKIISKNIRQYYDIKDESDIEEFLNNEEDI